MEDALDAIMRIMDAAFDPAYGEAWTRRQVSDAMTIPSTAFLLAGPDGRPPAEPKDAIGFAMCRSAADEHELLLIAVLPQARGRGIGDALMLQFIEMAGRKGANRLFLEMRAGNPAERLYRRHGFMPVGRRPAYYHTGTAGPFDAITYARQG